MLQCLSESFVSRPLKLLLSAYACEPDRGSEPGVGWHQVTQAARFHDTWVITRSNNRPAIEKALAREALPNVHWVYFDLPPWARFWKKGERGIHLYYVLWQLGAFFTARDLSRRIDFDLVHPVTFVNYWLPTLLLLVPFRQPGYCCSGPGPFRLSSFRLAILWLAAF